MGQIDAYQFYSAGFNHTYRVKTVDDRIYYLRAYRSGAYEMPRRTISKQAQKI